MKGKKEKLARIREILRDNMPHTETSKHFNFLAEELQKKYNIVDTENVSSNDYDPLAIAIIEENVDGLLLDCGAGKRSHYYPHIVNLEIWLSPLLDQAQYVVLPVWRHTRKT
jgi:hypothetical protein